MSNQSTIVALMANGIHGLINTISSDEFQIIVNGEKTRMSIIEALLLSPRVASQLQSDSTMREYVISNDQIESGSLSSLLSLFISDSIRITVSSLPSLILLAQCLGNHHFSTLLFNFKRKNQTKENEKENANTNTNAHVIDITLDEITNSNILFDLSSISEEDRELLDLETLSTILSSDSLRIESEEWLLHFILSLGADYSTLLNYVRFEFMSDEGISSFVDNICYFELTEDIWHNLVRRLKHIEDYNLKRRRFSEIPTKQIDSSIISSIPSLLDEFNEKQYELLYRGSRDGFESVTKHRLVDGHSHTLTLIETTRGYIFGCYIVCCNDSSNSWKTDDSLKSFIFTLKNPHKLSPHKFPLKADRKQYAMHCHSSDRLMWIGWSGSIVIYDNCNINTKSCTGYWDTDQSSYANDTGLDGNTLFAGEKNFTVKELEIFELID
jgi:hypothetical protein